MKKGKVLLGMSGGVDSGVSALLLQKNGYDVIGMTMQMYGDDNSQTTGDAKKVCENLGIKHTSYDLKKEFKCNVIDNFINEYANQRTPNPCIECNKHMKFGLMFEKAKELECEYIATGHYAKIEYSEKYKRYVLKKANNILKDQSYVLYAIPKEMLNKIIFPLGEFATKEEVRKVALENKLQVANKPDSEDICFIPDGDYKVFLEKNSNIKPKEGNIVTLEGKVLGKHNGLYNYTIGQRKGLGISYKEPLFVIGFNKSKNELIVGEKEKIYKKEMLVNNINLLLIDDLQEKMRVAVKIRYSSKEEMATIEKIEEDLIRVVFDNPVARITPGQSAVFYIDDIVVGGGKILK